jgi:hypothetical protein
MGDSSPPSPQRGLLCTNESRANQTGAKPLAVRDSLDPHEADRFVDCLWTPKLSCYPYRYNKESIIILIQII